MKKEKKEGIAGILVPAGIMIGMGVGFLTDQLVAAMFIGLGAGFLAMFIAMLVLRRKK
jgi:hypothetical protein